MAPNSGDRNEGGHREGSRLSTSRQSHNVRHKRARHDQGSVDSGYEGSSAAGSPRVAKQIGPEETHSQDATKAREDDNSGHDTDSDTEYDPKAKYYLNVDDNDYQNISFQGGDPSSGRPESSQPKVKARGHEDEYIARRHRSSHYRHRSPSSQRHRSTSTSTSSSGSGSDSRGSGGRSRHKPPNRYTDSSRSQPPQVSSGRALSPITSETSEGWHKSPERRTLSSPRSNSRRTRRRRASSADASDLGSRSPDAAEIWSRRSSGNLQRAHRLKRTSTGKGSERRASSEGGSSSYKGAADMDDAWYKTFKERLTKGVDMNQVKKVGLDAAAVAAVKVAVGTQIPWKQRIPKTIAVGLAAAVTDFLVSKTSFKPKGMVGTMYMRQFVEIALANLIINPASNRVNQRFGAGKDGQGGGQGAKDKTGTQSSAVAGGASRRGGGRGRR